MQNSKTEVEQLAVALLCMDFAKRRRRPHAVERNRPAVAEARATIHIAVQHFLQVLGVRLAMLARGMTAKVQKAAADDHDVTGAAESADYDPLKQQVEPQITRIAKDGAKAGLQQVDADVEKMLAQVNEQATTWAQERAGELIDLVSETTRDRVRELVAQAIREGWSNDQLADALLGDGAFSGYRAEMIARTETAAADISGNLIGWRESGVVVGKEWITSHNGNVCAECDAMDGEMVGIDADFSGGDPPLHPRCECDLLPVLKEDDG